MIFSARLRIGAGVAAAALVVASAAAFVMAQPRTAAAAPAYSDGFVAFGNIGHSEWTTSAGIEVRLSPSMSVESFQYSPDVRQVAVEANAQLWVASAGPGGAIGALRRLEGVPSGRLAWTPDGSEVLFSQAGSILAVPADGGGAPTAAVPGRTGCSDSEPQVTTRGTVYFTRRCSSSSGETLMLYRPGDQQPRAVTSHGDAVVSRDGSRLLWLADRKLFVASGGTSVDDTRQIPEAAGAAAADFAPSGDIVFLTNSVVDPQYTVQTQYWIRQVADLPGAPVRMVTSGYLGRLVPGLNVLLSVNGPSQLPARPVADRVGGSDRIDTAIKASQWSYDGRDRSGRHAGAAVLARADQFPDALSGTPLAIESNGPVLLTPSGTLDPRAGTELKRLLAPGSTVYLLGGTAALSPAVADAVHRLGLNPVRLGGPDRYATAVAIATAIAGDHPDSVLVATGTNYPDALTAGVAAGQARYGLSTAISGGVVVLTDGAIMPAVTRAYLERLNPHTSPASVYAVGGPAAAAVDAALPHLPRLTRLVGADRYATAAEVAASDLYGGSASGRYSTAAVATGTNFPDAVSGGAVAGAQGGPLLLTDGDGLPPQERNILRAARISDLVVLGGVTAVSDRSFGNAAAAAFGPSAWDVYTNRAAPPLR
ncbi:MAG: hypothetical protein HOW97_11010 [Catenulispora sp.]|nr:hypothetical protein [Catenulispora sp.]